MSPISYSEMTKVIWLKYYRNSALDMRVTKSHLHRPNLRKIISNWKWVFQMEVLCNMNDSDLKHSEQTIPISNICL